MLGMGVQKSVREMVSRGARLVALGGALMHVPVRVQRKLLSVFIGVFLNW